MPIYNQYLAYYNYSLLRLRNMCIDVTMVGQNQATIVTSIYKLHSISKEQSSLSSYWGIEKFYLNTDTPRR